MNKQASKQPAKRPGRGWLDAKETRSSQPAKQHDSKTQ